MTMSDTAREKYQRRLLWSLVAFGLFIAMMSGLDSEGGPCGQGILLVFLFPFAATFGLIAISAGWGLFKLRRTSSIS